MRARRRSSKGRREPMFWSRVCFDTSSGSIAGPDDAVECDESLARFGVVLFDATAGQLNATESRITLRKLHWPVAVNFVATGATLSPHWWWCVVFKTSDDITAIIANSTPLALLLDGSKDVLDVRVWHVDNTFSGGTAVALQGGLDAITRQPEFVLSAQRKLEVDDKIVALFGFQVMGGGSLATGQTVAMTVGGIVSALWQRTLR